MFLSSHLHLRPHSQISFSSFESWVGCWRGRVGRHSSNFVGRRVVYGRRLAFWYYCLSAKTTDPLPANSNYHQTCFDWIQILSFFPLGCKFLNFFVWFQLRILSFPPQIDFSLFAVLQSKEVVWQSVQFVLNFVYHQLFRLEQRRLPHLPMASLLSSTLLLQLLTKVYHLCFHSELKRELPNLSGYK